MREYLDTMKPEELESFGHDAFTGSEQMLAHLHTIDLLAKYDKRAAWSEYLEFMETNFSGLSIQVHA